MLQASRGGKLTIPKKGANLGVNSDSAMMAASLDLKVELVVDNGMSLSRPSDTCGEQ